MATTVDVGGNGTLFVGEDKDVPFSIIDKNGIPIDATGMSLVFDVRKKDNSPDPAILSRTDFIISGVYNADPLTNTQIITLRLTDEEMNLFTAKTYRYSLKRMTSGSETVLVRGNFKPEKATAP